MRALSGTRPSDAPAQPPERPAKPTRSLGRRLLWFLVIWFLSLGAIALLAALLQGLLRAVS
jgi:hypothetical protein